MGLKHGWPWAAGSTWAPWNHSSLHGPWEWLEKGIFLEERSLAFCTATWRGHFTKQMPAMPYNTSHLWAWGISHLCWEERPTDLSGCSLLCFIAGLYVPVSYPQNTMFAPFHRVKAFFEINERIDNKAFKPIVSQNVRFCYLSWRVTLSYNYNINFSWFFIIFQSFLAK